MEIFPELYVGHDKAEIDLCNFLQEKWKDPKYDNFDNNIYESILTFHPLL
jgi:hypothetical protein